MAYEDLLKSVEESAHDKELELRNRQKTAIDEIRARTKKQAGEIRKTYIDDTEKSITTEKNKLLYLTRAENKEQMIRVRETAFDRAFAESENRLRTLRSDQNYPAVFLRLLKEAAGTIGDGAFVVHIDPRDEALCKKTLGSLNLSSEIRSDITTSGGVTVSLPDNSVVISNTVESRLGRAKELRRKEIHAILSGE